MLAAPAVAVIGALAGVAHLYGPSLAGATGPARAGAAAGPLPASHETGPGQQMTTPDAQPASHARAENQPPTPTPRPTRSRPAPPSPAPSATSHPTASARPTAPASGGHGAVTCSGPATGPLPANYAAIVGFLTGHGYTGNAAAGIAGNIYQESGGNPESAGDGGGGLIGWTPLPSGYLTGNPSADLRTQLQAILGFNQIWAQYIPTLNAAGSPAQAADIYVTDFERAGVPAPATGKRPPTRWPQPAESEAGRTQP